VTTFALAIGLAVVNLTKPGAGLDISRLAKGDILQIVFFAVLFGFAAVTVHGDVKALTDVLEKTLEVFFRLV